MDIRKQLTNLADDLDRFRNGDLDRLSLREASRATHVLVRGKAVMLVEQQMAANGIPAIPNDASEHKVLAAE